MPTFFRLPGRVVVTVVSPRSYLITKDLVERVFVPVGSTCVVEVGVFPAPVTYPNQVSPSRDRAVEFHDVSTEGNSVGRKVIGDPSPSLEGSTWEEVRGKMVRVGAGRVSGRGGKDKLLTVKGENVSR